MSFTLQTIISTRQAGEEPALPSPCLLKRRVPRRKVFSFISDGVLGKVGQDTLSPKMLLAFLHNRIRRVEKEFFSAAGMVLDAKQDAAVKVVR